MRSIYITLRRIGRIALRTVFDFGRGVYQHLEAILLLALSSVGLNVLLGEIPFIIAMPMWIEATMLIPALACIGVLAIAKSAEKRSKVFA